MVKHKTSRKEIYNIIFEANTPGGKAFDIILLISILLSVIVVFLDSVSSIHHEFGHELYLAEWFFTILFTIEYILRIYSATRKIRYIFSFYGIIDLLSILPTFISLILAGTQFLIVIRTLRLMRIFRILKLDRYVGASSYLTQAIRSGRHKIMVFLTTVFSIVIIVGAMMYLIEGPSNGFTSIPRSIYWAIVTLTTVGYGDIAPQTVWGQFLASLIMILGYSIIAVPTGIITAEMTRQKAGKEQNGVCKHCGKKDHEDGARFCCHCGSNLSGNLSETTDS